MEIFSGFILSSTDTRWFPRKPAWKISRTGFPSPDTGQPHDRAAKVRARRGPLALRSAPGQELSLILRTTSRGHSTHSRCPKPRQCDSTFAGVGCQKAVRVAGFDHFRIDACGCRPTTSWAYAQVSAALLQAHPSFSRCGAGKPPPWCHSTHSRLVLCEITRLVLFEQAGRG